MKSGIGLLASALAFLPCASFGAECVSGVYPHLAMFNDIRPDLTQEIFPGSVGGTPANRMIHRETNQLMIGPYVIDAKGLSAWFRRRRCPGGSPARAKRLRQLRVARFSTLHIAQAATIW